MNTKNKPKPLAEILRNRKQNIKEASTWPRWEIEEELQRANSAREVFLKKTRCTI